MSFHDAAQSKMSEENKKSRSEKSKPLEFSCRAPAAVPKPKRQGLMPRRAEPEEVEDPRFNRKVAGDFDSYKFGKAYGFLDDYRASEKRDLTERLRSKKLHAEERTAMEKSLARMASQDLARKRLSEESEIRKELKIKELEAVEKTGKKAYYHPRSVVKKIMRERQDSELGKNKGQLERVRSKQEKRKVAKERKHSSMPKIRRVIEA